MSVGKQLVDAVRKGELTQSVRDLFAANRSLISTVYSQNPLRLSRNSLTTKLALESTGESLLHIACSYGDLTMATELIDHCTY